MKKNLKEDIFYRLNGRKNGILLEHFQVENILLKKLNIMYLIL